MSRRTIQRFEVLEEIGRGGMGAVYRARDLQLQRDVAIKVLAGGGESLAQLSRVLATERTVDLRTRAAANGDLLAEARVMAQLSHPNVLAVFEVGLDAGAVFLVMEHVDGINLRAWLRTRPAPRAIRDAFIEAGRGLAAAHARGIVHRDFKPDNVLIGSDGRVRVADFGLSLLATPSECAIRYDAQAGTPAYMAPEQIRGMPATDRSDVYAFSLSLAEAWIGRRVALGELDAALREADVPAPARAVLAAGLDDDPAKRPAMTRLLAALAVNAPRRGRRVALASAITGLVGVSAAALYLRGEPTAVCEPARVPADAAELVRAVGPATRPQTRDVAALVERRAGEISAERRAACEEQARGQATQAQIRVRQSCLDRRAIELSAIAHHAAAAHPEDLRGLGDSAYLVNAASCRELTLAPLPADLGRHVALVDHFLQAPALPTAEWPEAFLAIERDAMALGELELASRAAMAAGFKLQDSDRVADALAAYRRSYRIAVDAHASDLAVRALVENANLASVGGDVAGARQLAMLALERCDHGGVSQWNHARALLALGRVLWLGGDYAAAIARYEQGRAALAASGRANPPLEIALRTDQLNPMIALRDRRAAALALARDNLVYLRDTDGVRSVNYAIALDGLSRALFQGGETAEAYERSREAVTTLLELRPPAHSFVIRQRARLAALALELGKFREGGDEYRAAIAACDSNEALRTGREEYLAGLAESEYNLGHHDEALRLLQRAIEESASEHGRDHQTTLYRVFSYASYALDLGRVEEASARYAEIEARYRKQDSTAAWIAFVRGALGAQIALAQARPHDAEAVARVALRSFAEPGAARDRAWLLYSLGASLVAQRRWQEALETAEASLADGHDAAFREDYLAMLDLVWAEAASGLGRIGDALSHARADAAVLARYPGQPGARKDVAALVRRLAARGRLPRRAPTR